MYNFVPGIFQCEKRNKAVVYMKIYLTEQNADTWNEMSYSFIMTSL